MGFLDFILSSHTPSQPLNDPILILFLLIHFSPLIRFASIQYLSECDKCDQVTKVPVGFITYWGKHKMLLSVSLTRCLSNSVMFSLRVRCSSLSRSPAGHAASFLPYGASSELIDRSSGRAETWDHITHYTLGQRSHNPSSYIPYLFAAVWVNRG